MSWQLASFLVIGAVLLGGFAWYERSRPPSQVVALVAALAALAIAGRIAFAAIPNVKPTTDIVIFAGELVADPLADQVVARVLSQQRHPTGGRDLASGRVDQASRRAQQRALAGAVAAHQRHALTALYSKVDSSQDVVLMVIAG